MRKMFELSDEQFERLLEASQPVPYMIIAGNTPPDPQENANKEWEKIGNEMGFKPYTVEPDPDGNPRFFHAETI